MRVLLCTVILFLSTLTVSYGQQADTQDDCESQETCTACIRSPNCIWCDVVIDEDVEKPPVRCVNQNQVNLEHDDPWCRQENIVNRTSNANFDKNDPLSSSRDKPVQIQPQIVKLQLRRGEDYHLKVRYRQAEDYPVDLYFLVDLSRSMETFRNNLSKLGARIAEAMKNLTANFRLGFGSFVDKDIRPMTADRPFWDEYHHYSFKNQMPLTNDYGEFRHKVSNSPVTGNWDDVEGGFDGVMQAIVCTEEIKWRSDARHLLVYVSDERAHIAGDGRLAGLLEPNDEKCHLNVSGYYSHAELQDYPSLGQINWQARKNNINIIFATVYRHKKIYDAVQTAIEGSSVGIFDHTSVNVIKLISGQYKELVKSLKMTSNSAAKFLDVQFFSKCLDGQLQRRDTCDGIRVNLTVDYDVVIKATDCPEDEKDWHQTIEIKPEGINERVIVDVELICGCKCSRNSTEAKNAPRTKDCHYHGFLDCGVCSCDEGYYGRWCQCENTKSLVSKDEASCAPDNSSKICSGQGNCICGSCTCGKWGHSEQKFYGKYCQCDDFSCKYNSDNEICSGNGRCKCGECKCDRGWTGTNCECDDDVSLCRPPGVNTKTCSGAGKCECGRCKCHEDKGRRGRFCEDCPSCPSQRCDEFKDCVECRIHKSGKIYNIDPKCQQCNADIVTVDEVEENPANLNPGEHNCLVIGEDGSSFGFTYVYANGGDINPIIIAEKDKKYPPIPNFVATTLGVILLTLLFGCIILLIWKISADLHDKREYDKFMKESTKATWEQGMNPLYREAVTTVSNPIFDRVLTNDNI